LTTRETDSRDGTGTTPSRSESRTPTPTTAYATFHTPYGPARWVTQYSDSYDYIRWGVHNLLTNRVYLNHGWMPVVC